MTLFLYYNKQPCETRKAVSDCRKTDYYQIHTDKHIANTLASPRKRGGGAAAIIFWLAVQYSDRPTFTILKLFRAVTVGIVFP